MTYDKNNIFAKILRGEIPCKKIYEDELCFVFSRYKSSEKNSRLLFQRVNILI